MNTIPRKLEWGFSCIGADGRPDSRALYVASIQLQERSVGALTGSINLQYSDIIIHRSQIRLCVAKTGDQA